MRFIVTLIFALSIRSCFAQNVIDIGLYGEHFQLGDRAQQSCGLMIHFPFAERFTLNYQAGFGPRQPNGLFVHAPAGAIGGGWLLANSNGGRWLSAFGLLMTVLPEGVGYYTTVGKFPTHVSINPLGVSYWYRRDPYYEKAKMSCNFMVRGKMLKTLGTWDIYLAPFAAATWIYAPSPGMEKWGVRAGVAIGLETDM